MIFFVDDSTYSIYIVYIKQKRKGEHEMKFYGFEYTSGRNTTTGQPNEGFERFHGKLSIAGNAVLFDSRKKRDQWVNEYCSSPGGRIAVSRAELRRLCAGMENKMFSDYLDDLMDDKFKRLLHITYTGI
jgi:hypothetical protein